MQTVFDIPIFAAGFGVSWFSTDAIFRLVAGGRAFVRSLEAEVTTLEVKLS